MRITPSATGNTVELHLLLHILYELRQQVLTQPSTTTTGPPLPTFSVFTQFTPNCYKSNSGFLSQLKCETISRNKDTSGIIIIKWSAPIPQDVLVCTQLSSDQTCTNIFAFQSKVALTFIHMNISVSCVNISVTYVIIIAKL